MRYYHYVDRDGGIIRIRARRMPSDRTRPLCGTWTVREYQTGEWQLPCFPEITWNTLKQLTYLGSIQVDTP